MAQLKIWLSTGLSKGYIGDEQRQIAAAIQCYRDSEQLEANFLSALVLNDKSNPLNRITLETLSITFWEPKLGGCFKHPVNELIKYICQYETKRDTNKQGYMNDPRNLILHQFKLTLVQLSTSEDANLFLTRVQKFTKILHDLWFADVFPPSDNEVTMKSLLYTLIQQVRIDIIPKVKSHIENSSAETKLKLLTDRLYEVLGDAFRFLIFIFYPTKCAPLSVTIKDFANLQSTDAEVRALMSTLNANMLKKYATVIHQITSLPEQNKALGILNNVNLLEDTNKVFDVFTHCENTQVGIASCFISSQILRQYFSTANILYETSKFHYIFMLATDCAKYGGNLLVYGICNSEFNVDLNECSSFLTLLEKSIDDLNKFAEEKWANLGARPTTEESIWKENYKYAFKHYCTPFKDKIMRCREALDDLLSSANRYTTEELMDKAKEAHERYLKGHQSFQTHRVNTLHPAFSAAAIDYNPISSAGSLLLASPSSAASAAAILPGPTKQEELFDSFKIKLQSFIKNPQNDEWQQVQSVISEIINTDQQNLRWYVKIAAAFFNASAFKYVIEFLKQTICPMQLSDQLSQNKWYRKAWFLLAKAAYYDYKLDQTANIASLEAAHQALITYKKISNDNIFAVEELYQQIQQALPQQNTQKTLAKK